MKITKKLIRLAEVTSTQWGMVTTAQANWLGISRVDLARMADAGHLERLMHGVYRDSGTPDDRWSALRAAWLSTNPKQIAETRDYRGGDVTVAGESAAQLNAIGDHQASRHEFVAPQRRQTQRRDIRYRQRELDPADVTTAEGLPVMTMERTIADLIESNVDFSLVADTLRDAVSRRGLDQERLTVLLAPLAARNGLPAGDGQALYDKLAEVAEIDAAEAQAIVRIVSSRPALQRELMETALKGYELAATKVLAGYQLNLGTAITKKLERFRPAVEALPALEALRTVAIQDALLTEAIKEAFAPIGLLAAKDPPGEPPFGAPGSELIQHGIEPLAMIGSVNEDEATGNE